MSRGVDRRTTARLTVSEPNIKRHAQAIAEGGVFGIEERPEVFERAAVTVASDMGAEDAWATSVIPGPVTLRAFAGIPNTTLTGLAASMPSYTLPSGTAGVAEGDASPEYDSVVRADLTALRYGRWSDVTAAVDAFDELSGLNSAHGVGVARDINSVDIGVLETAASTAAAYSEQALREAILTVAGAALVEPSDVVVVGTAADVSVFNGFSPANGEDRGSNAVRLYGARIYVSGEATSGQVTAFAPSAFRTFQSRLRSASTIAPDTGTHRFGQWLHSTPVGIAIVGGAAAVASA